MQTRDTKNNNNNNKSGLDNSSSKTVNSLGQNSGLPLSADIQF